MEIEIEKEVSFKCLEGTFRGALDDVKAVPDSKDGDEQVRLVFVVDVPWMRDKAVKVGRNFNPEGRELQMFLKAWLANSLQNYTTDGKLQLESLVGQSADIVTKHGPMNKKFKYPFVKIDEIRLPGSLRLSQSPKQNNN